MLYPQMLAMAKQMNLTVDLERGLVYTESDGTRQARTFDEYIKGIEEKNPIGVAWEKHVGG